MRLLVHAGFHKTGTTSIQRMLQRDRALLAPALRILLREDMHGLTEAARAWSAARDGVEWGLFRYEAARVLGALDPADPRPVLLCSEDLSGHMPGRHGLTAYDAAPRLMQGLMETAADLLGPGVARFEFVFTTRAAAPWVRSCHAQHICATRMTEDADSYARAFLPHADLQAMAAAVGRAVNPAPVHVAALEDFTDTPLGPIDALFEVLGLDPALRQQVQPIPAANVSVPGPVLAELLSLNRSDADWSVIKQRKRRLITRARRAAAGPA